MGDFEIKAGDWVWFKPSATFVQVGGPPNYRQSEVEFVEGIPLWVAMGLEHNYAVSARAGADTALITKHGIMQHVNKIDRQGAIVWPPELAAEPTAPLTPHRDPAPINRQTCGVIIYTPKEALENDL